MRPAYHFTPRKNWLSDPNGLVHDGRLWHMFYQYNPFGEDWGHMSWGHAVSADLVNWQERAPALLANEARMVFSGSAVVDTENCAAFGSNALVAVYTAAAAKEPPQHQAQALAFSTDGGASWADYQDNPVIDLALADFRDPYVFRHEPSESWVMVVVKSKEHIAQIYRSHDLKSWTLASEIQAGEAPGEIWECPALVELPILGTGRSRWLFKVDALSGAPGSGALYLTGDFDGYNFVPDTDIWQLVDFGRDFYAAIAWNGPRDSLARPAWIGWMGNHSYQHDFPKGGWRGVMSLPRRMGLVERPNGIQLAQAVEPGIAQLFGEVHRLNGCQEVASACRIELEPDFAGTLTITDGLGSNFLVKANGDSWHVRRSDQNLPFLDCYADVPRLEGSASSLWIDSETIEMIDSEGACCASFQHRIKTEHLQAESDQTDQILIATLA